METIPAPKKRGRPRKIVVVEEKVLIPEETVTIKEIGTRTSLSEGREHQLGFTFLKKLNDNSFETVYPISPCKDYLNDVVFSENTGKDCYAYGLNYKKIGIFAEPLAYMAMKICPHRGGTPYMGQDVDTKNLNDNFKKVEEFINFFEEQLKLDVKTEVIKVKDNLFLLRTPIYWTKYTYLISLYSLLVRCGQWYTEGDKLSYFNNFSKLNDVYNVKNVVPKLNKIIAGILPDQKLNSMTGTTAVHNMGIVTFQF